MRASRSFGIAVSVVLIGAGSALSQVQGDGLLGTLVNGLLTGECVGFCVINGGVNPSNGRNLFHSFNQFSLPDGDVAAFDINPSVQNLFVRVTGSGDRFISSLNGSILTSSPTNFFLLNPNGVLIGPGASLLNGAGFTATTAERIRFQDGGFFDVRTPDSLLSVSVPTGFQFGQLPRPISVTDSVIFSGVTSNVTALTLAGGDVSLSGATVILPSGRIDVASLSSSGIVALQTDGRLGVPSGVEDMTIENSSTLGVIGEGTGGIELTARNITLNQSGATMLRVPSGLGTLDPQIGDINLNATDTIKISGLLSGIVNGLGPFTTGKGGDIRLAAKNVLLLDGTTIAVGTGGIGDAGDVRIEASESVLLEGPNNRSDISAQAESNGTGKSGNIYITAPVLELNDKALISTNTSGIGDAGEVRVISIDRVILKDGAAIESSVGSVNADGTVNTGAVGNGGKIQIDTASLDVSNGSQIRTSTRGRGNAGFVQIVATDHVLLKGVNQNPLAASGIASGVRPDGIGNGTGVLIITPVLDVIDGAQISSVSEGLGNGGNVQIIANERIRFSGTSRDGRSISAAFSGIESTGIGNGGNVLIETPLLEMLDGAQLIATTRGLGNAGNIQIMASDRVVFKGTSLNSPFASGINNAVSPGGQGLGGNVFIETPVFELINGAQINASTQGKGDAGSVTIAATDRITIQGFSAFTTPSGIFTNTGDKVIGVGTGKGGNITLMSEALNILDGAWIDARTINDQRGGDIALTLGQLNVLNGGQITSASDQIGPAGTIDINVRNNILIAGSDPDRLTHIAINPRLPDLTQPESSISVRARDLGAAGNLNLTATRLDLADSGQLIADSNAATGGNINITLSEFLGMRNSSLISATAGRAQGGGDGGNITINAPLLIANSGENNDIIANAFTGKGGSLAITANAILNFTQNDRKPFETLRAQSTNDISASSEFGSQGILNLVGLNVDPSRGSVQLPIGLIDNSNRITNPCSVNNQTKESSFVVTGRGGLASNPGDWIREPSSDWVSLDRTSSQPSLAQMSTPQLILEADSWQRNAQGKIQIVAKGETAPQMVAPHCGSIVDSPSREKLK
jgi:filamentous hemagglutinin family protein